MSEKENGVCTYCRKTTQYSTWSRQCFMNDEPCVKLKNIQKEREALYSRGEINAFVIMNFSNTSDIMFKWRLRKFIESLKDYLYLNPTTNELLCLAESEDPKCLHDLGVNVPPWIPVAHINVIRADSDSVSNYIMCNRICQQIQVADLVIVDVSVENANVFYEFGVAAAFDKLILPICFSKSFYHFSMPEGARECLEKWRKDCEASPKDPAKKIKMESFQNMVVHHIDCYPWRRKLFEYYGIRYRSDKSQVGYTNYKDIMNPLYGYSDIKYSQFPYDAKIDRITGESRAYDEEWFSGVFDNKYYADDTVGSLLYSRLSNSYGTGTVSGKFNTVIIYSMDTILNEAQAGQCIINFYQNMTAQIGEEFCFCGDRIGIMGQSDTIADDPKDSKTGQKPLYQVDDIIRAAMNEATGEAHKHLVKPVDYFLGEGEPKNPQVLSKWHEQAIQIAREHTKKRCIPINPDEPIHVAELLHGIQKGILSNSLLESKSYDYKHFFCLFHVTLHTLRNTNEVVVDLSGNSLQALFWLGVAHGRNVPAITVRHIPTQEELRLSGVTAPSIQRSIFDVEGLSTVTLYSNDIEGFFKQLTKTQISIDQHRKLALSSTTMDGMRENILNAFFDTPSGLDYNHLLRGYHAIEQHRMRAGDDLLSCEPWEMYSEFSNMLNTLYLLTSDPGMNAIWKTRSMRRQIDGAHLESYYRDLFWKRMLQYNELQLYTNQAEGHHAQYGAPKRINIAWEIDAIGELAHYMTKHATFSNFRIRSIPQNSPDSKANQSNFICIGGKTVPLAAKDHGQALFQHIRSKIRGNEEAGENVVHQLLYGKATCSENGQDIRRYRGFFSENGRHNAFAQFADIDCITQLFANQDECEKLPDFVPVEKHFEPVKLSEGSEKKDDEAFVLREEDNIPCQLRKNKDNKFEQLAQLILWREVPEEPADKVKYWVSLIGVSGPATLALTSLLVDDQQKKDLLQEKREKPAALPLNNIQTQIRKTLMKKYNDALKPQLESIMEWLKTEHAAGRMKEVELTEDELPKLHKAVSYATQLYLSTVLYQYFFPFLSRADEERIYNGMSAFVSSGGFLEMFEKKHRPLLKRAVIGALRNTISGLLGVEALYCVDVKYITTDKDNCQPQNIQLLRLDDAIPNETKGTPMISCLFKDQ